MNKEIQRIFVRNCRSTRRLCNQFQISSQYSLLKNSISANSIHKQSASRRSFLSQKLKSTMSAKISEPIAETVKLNNTQKPCPEKISWHANVKQCCNYNPEIQFSKLG